MSKLEQKYSLEATPLETTFIPHYNITKPLIPSSVTAIVSSGSHNTESTPNTIDIDSFGRIRVIFHFDPHYPTSCYIRFANCRGWLGKPVYPQGQHRSDRQLPQR